MAAGPQREAELRRLRMRSWRRGMRETDLILGPFADGALAGLGAEELAAFAALLSECDQDVYAWVSGTAAAPAPLARMVERLRAFHNIA